MGRSKRIARNVVQMGPDKLARVCEQSPVLAQIDPLKRHSRNLAAEAPVFMSID